MGPEPAALEANCLDSSREEITSAHRQIGVTRDRFVEWRI
jgi:hypothetical protein